jgi:hypothetical protein
MKFKWMKNLHGTKWIMFIHLNNTTLSCVIKHVVFRKSENVISKEMLCSMGTLPYLLRLRANLHHGP